MNINILPIEYTKENCFVNIFFNENSFEVDANELIKELQKIREEMRKEYNKNKREQENKLAKQKLKEMNIDQKVIHEQIKFLLDNNIKVESYALGRMGEIKNIRDHSVYIKIRGKNYEGVTTFSGGDKVVLTISDGNWIVENDWDYYDKVRS